MFLRAKNSGFKLREKRKMSTEDDWEVEKQEQKETTTKEDVVTDLVSQVSTELRKAHKSQYDVQEAERTAALCLDAQEKLVYFLSEAELIAKERKMNIESVEGDRYLFYKYSYKIDGKEAKLSDAVAQKLVDKDEDVLKAKREQIEAEANFSKWRNLFGILKDAHIFFRGIAKGKADWM